MSTQTSRQQAQMAASQMGNRQQGGMHRSAGRTLAGTLLLLLGVYHFFVGLAAVSRANYFTRPGSIYAYDMSTKGWGWIHMILGVFLAATALFLLTGAAWARALAIGLAVISAIANFFFLPFQPLWSLLLIAVSLLSIWALSRMHSGAGSGEGEHEQDRGAQQRYTGAQDRYSTTDRYTTTERPAMTGSTGQRWPDNAQAAGSRTYESEKPGIKQEATGRAGQAAQQVVGKTHDATDRATSAVRGVTGRGNYNPTNNGQNPPPNR